MQGNGDVSVNLPKYQLCWDCANAVGGCKWSKHLKPIKGWEAVKTRVGTPVETYLIIKCPLFVRDAYDGGIRKVPLNYHL